MALHYAPEVIALAYARDYLHALRSDLEDRFGRFPLSLEPWKAAMKRIENAINAAEPDVETEWVDYGDTTDVDSEGREYSLTGWYVGPPGLAASGGPFPTEAAALKAAREES